MEQIINNQDEKENIEAVKKYSLDEILNMVSESSKNNTPLPKEIEMLLKGMQEVANPKTTGKNEDKVIQNSVGFVEGLSLDDIKSINENARMQVENYIKAPFDVNNPEHKEYFEYFKQKALKEKEKEVKLRKFYASLHDKYGDMYDSVEKAARNTFESMAFKDARDILSSRMHGNVEKLLSFYDSVFNEMQSRQQESPVKAEDGSVIFPPKAMKGGSVKHVKNKNTYENFI